MYSLVANTRISLRLPILIVIALVVMLGASSTLYYTLFRADIQTRVEELARSSAAQAQASFSRWLEAMHRAAADLAQGTLAPPAMQAFTQAVTLQAPGWLDDIRAAYDGTATASMARPAYDAVHEQFHGFLTRHRDLFGYQDLLLITPSGDVIYSIEKGGNFGVSLASDDFADAPLTRIWREAMASPAPRNIGSDVEISTTGSAEAAVFIARRMVDRDNPEAPALGVIVIRLSFAAAEAALGAATGLGPEDIVYLLGADGRLRSTLSLDSDLALLDPLPDLTQISAARNAETRFFPDTPGLGGASVDAAVHSFEARGFPMSVVVELNHAAHYAALNDFVQRAAIFIVLCTVASLGIGYLVARSITRPLNAFAQSMTRIADEDFTSPVIGTERHDEIGGLSRALASFRDQLLQARKSRAAPEAAREEQSQVVVNLVGRAGDTLTMIIERVGNIDTLIGTIATGAREQSAGLNEINIGVSQLDQVTQQNAAMVEEVTAASTTLRHESEALDQRIGQFRTAAHGQIAPDTGRSVASRDSDAAELPEPLETTEFVLPAVPVDTTDAWRAELADSDTEADTDDMLGVAANSGRWHDF